MLIFLKNKTACKLSYQYKRVCSEIRISPTYLISQGGTVVNRTCHTTNGGSLEIRQSKIKTKQTTFPPE